MTSKQTAHTPGPWGHYNAKNDSFGPERGAIGTVSQGWPQWWANARLCAAAPDLLAAAEAIANYYGDGWSDNPAPNEPGHSSSEWSVAHRVRAAIAKARGEKL